MIQNPILSGFCPDPSIVRVGEDFYLATSTFEWWPGVRLFHSRDLKNWEQLASPLRRLSQLDMRGEDASCGVWAPCLSYADGLFWLVYTDVKTRGGLYRATHNYLVWTDDILGEWSEPVYLNSTGFDPSLFHDPLSGKKYLVNMRNGFLGILLQEYDHQKRALVGEVRNIFRGTAAGKTEGPHLYRRGQYYYLLTAEGGTGYEHRVTMARARDIRGPYEIDENNPILTSAGAQENPLQKSGHADLVDTPDGEWYLVHLCGRPIQGRSCVLGRETAIQRVGWTGDGWLRLEGGVNKPRLTLPDPRDLPEHPFPEPPPRDDFNDTVLDVRYACLRAPIGDDASLTARPGFLRLYGRESYYSRYRVSLIARRQRHFDCAAQTKLDFTPELAEQMVGFAWFYDNHHFYMLVKVLNEANGGCSLRLLKNDWDVAGFVGDPIAVPEGALHLRIEVHGLEGRFFYSADGERWTPVGPACDGSILSDEHARGFTGAHFAMYCHDVSGGGHPADFDYFEYREIEPKEF